MLRLKSVTSSALTACIQSTSTQKSTTQQKVLEQRGPIQEANPLHKWLNFWATQDLQQSVSDTIAGEKTERIYTNQDPIDYGYSFPGLNAIRQSCLETVRHFCEAEGRQAVVADLGAGLGNMTWKLLAAGAQVDAFELNDTAVQVIKKKVRSLNPEYWQRKSLENILKIFPANILTFLAKKEFREKYDFIWIGNVLHFLNPDELKLISRILQVILKPGGKIFVETNSVETFLSQPTENTHLIVNAVVRAKTNNTEFPGFIALNSATIINCLLNQVVHATNVAAYNQQEMRALSIPSKPNAYGKGFLAPTAFNDESKGIIQSLRKVCDSSFSYMAINSFYQILNLLDEATAMTLFKQAGFTQVETSLRDIKDKKSKHHGLNVVAHKPFIPESNSRQNPQEADELYFLQTLNGPRSLLVDKPSLAFRRPYSLSIFAPQLRPDKTMELFSLRPK